MSCAVIRVTMFYTQARVLKIIPMDLNFDSFLFLLSVLSLVFFALLKSGKATKTENYNSKLPPGPRKLPIIGSMHHLISPRLIHHTLAELAKKHGPLMHLQLGQLSTVIISSSEMAKEAFKTHDLNFSDRPTTLHMKIFSYDFSDVGLAPYGSVWRRGRKICVQELLSVKQVKSFQFLMEEEVSNLISSISLSTGTTVNLTDKMFGISSSIIARAAFGKKYMSHERFLSSVRKGLKLLTTINIAEFFPSLEFLNIFSGSISKLEEVHKEMDNILGDIIEDRRSRRVIGSDIKEANKKEEYLVDVLLRHQESGDIEINNIKAIIVDMFAAGSETTSLNLINVMSELVKNPRVMVKAQAEVRKFISGKENKLDKSVLDELSYLKCVIKESFRLHPSGPLLIPRQSRETCEINGYTIPAKTQVMVHAWALGRDPKYWKDAESFYPERFYGSSIDFKGFNYEYIPFGTGRRMCPGMAFALPIMQLVLVQLLYHFNWELPNGLKAEELDMTESLVGLAIHRKHELLLSPTPYTPFQE